MSHADTIRAYYTAWLADDLEAVFALCTDDLVANNVPIGPLHGKPAVREFFARFGKGMTDKRYDVERILDETVIGGRVIEELRIPEERLNNPAVKGK